MIWVRSCRRALAGCSFPSSVPFFFSPSPPLLYELSPPFCSCKFSFPSFDDERRLLCNDKVRIGGFVWFKCRTSPFLFVSVCLFFFRGWCPFVNSSFLRNNNQSGTQYKRFDSSAGGRVCCARWCSFRSNTVFPAEYVYPPQDPPFLPPPMSSDLLQSIGNSSPDRCEGLFRAR